MKKILLIIMSFFVLNLNVLAEEDFAPNGKSAILVDNLSGKVLYEKNADEKLAPASMTKLASMLMVMEAIDNGNLKFEDKVTISEEAANMGGSQVFLQAGEVYTVYDLLKSVAIASGNDAVVALAEKIGGSQSGFIDMLNKRLKEIGATNTNFVNAHGLDAEGHYSTARDMSIIARELLKHPKILEFTSIYEEYLEKNDGSRIWLVNTNKLVRFYDGVDGLKTGFTKTAGYCLTATAKKNGMRIIAVVMGEPDSKTRNKEVTEMLDYSFAQYETEEILSNDRILDKVKILKGKKDYIEVVPKESVTFLNKKTEPKKNATFELKLDTLSAPIKVGDKVGILKIKEDNNVREVEVTVKEDVEKANVFEFYLRSIKDIFTGNI